jgi:hypothetical protein
MATDRQRTPLRAAPAPAPDEATFKGFGFELPLPRWAQRSIAALVIVAVAVTVYSTAYPLLNRSAADRWLDFVAASDPRILTDPRVQSTLNDPAIHAKLEQVNQLLVNMIRINEQNKHFLDRPTDDTSVFSDPVRGEMRIRYYASDGCALLLRKNAGAEAATVPFWVPVANVKTEPPPGDILRRSDAGGAERKTLWSLFRLPTAHAAGDARDRIPTQACGGRCLNPHPGNFTSWNGQQNGCWLAVWRRWPEGCTHYQWFNTCNGSWDSNPDNTPRVYWTCCVH